MCRAKKGTWGGIIKANDLLMKPYGSLLWYKFPKTHTCTRIDLHRVYMEWSYNWGRIMVSIGKTNKSNMTKTRVVKERVYFFPPHLWVIVHHGGSLTGTQKGQEPGGGAIVEAIENVA